MILFHWMSRQLGERAGQPVEWPATVRVSSRYNDVRHAGDVVLLSIQQSTTGAGHTAMLGREHVVALHAALIAGANWSSDSEPGRDPGDARSRDTYAELAGLGESRTLTVIGYGHNWKRKTVHMPVAEAERLAAALADWLAHGWAGCTVQTFSAPPKEAPPKLTPCAPTGSFADPELDLTTCRNDHRLTCRWCGATMVKEWDPALKDWIQRADDGSHYGQEKPPHGENGYEYSAWLRDQCEQGNKRAFGAYSMSTVFLATCGDPFSHRHLTHSGAGCGVDDCSRTTTSRAPMDVPWCHDQPMWLTGEGWQCRVGRQAFPFATAI